MLLFFILLKPSHYLSIICSVTFSPAFCIVTFQSLSSTWTFPTHTQREHVLDIWRNLCPLLSCESSNNTAARGTKAWIFSGFTLVTHFTPLYSHTDFIINTQYCVLNHLCVNWTLLTLQHEKVMYIELLYSTKIHKAIIVTHASAYQLTIV